MDLLRGIRALAASARISDLDEGVPGEGEDGIFHFRIGRNGDPHSKIDDFARRLKSRDSRWDIAAMKLCYVDINRNSNVNDIFAHYLQITERLTSIAPGLRLVHITVPLRAIRLGLRSRVRMFARQAVDSLEDNLQRDHYNSLLRAEFQDDTQLFDLALLEATQPGGKIVTRSYRGKQAPALYAGFTDDGGHLNQSGEVAVAREFMTFIEKLRT